MTTNVSLSYSDGILKALLIVLSYWFKHSWNINIKIHICVPSIDTQMCMARCV